MMKRPPATRNLKRLFTLLVLSILVVIVVVPMRAGRTSASAEVGESHEVVEAQGEHVVEAEEHGVVEGHGAEAEEHGVGHVEEPWWRFTGWEVVFAVLAAMFFLFLTRWLPLILEDKSGGSSL